MRRARRDLPELPFYLGATGGEEYVNTSYISCPLSLVRFLLYIMHTKTTVLLGGKL